MPAQLTGPGYFGPARRPRILTVGLEAPSPLAELQELISIGCKELSFEQDKREYVPHLTLGRIREGGSAEVLEPLLEKVSQSFPSHLLQKVSQRDHAQQVLQLATKQYFPMDHSGVVGYATL